MITASMCISTLARSQSPSVSLHSHDYGLHVDLQTRSITASKYIFKEQRRVYPDTEVPEVDRVTGSIYSADPGVDRHHPISISSNHTEKIHTLSFPTFGLTRSVRDIVDPCNCVGSLTVGSIISCHPIPTLLVPEPLCESEQLFLMNSVWMPREVRRSVDGGLSGFKLHCFTSPASKCCISKCSLNGRGLLLLRLCSSTICSQIDRMYI